MNAYSYRYSSDIIGRLCRGQALKSRYRPGPDVLEFLWVGGLTMRGTGSIPFTCHGCHTNFSITMEEADRNEPIRCPRCTKVYRLRQEQMKQLAPGRLPVRE